MLIGKAILPVPADPRIRHLGFLTDTDKFDAMAAADVLIMPSYYESLSMVALEAWGIGKPVLANGRCDVLKGQCLRSNGGLYYESYAEFAEALYSITSSPSLSQGAGRNGRAYFRAALRVAGDRAEVPRRCSASCRRRAASAAPAIDAAARLLRSQGSHGAGGRGCARGAFRQERCRP